MRATEDLLTEFFVNGHDGAVEQWEFGDYEGALEEIQSRGIDITKPDKRDAQEGRPGRIAIAPEGVARTALGSGGPPSARPVNVSYLRSASISRI